ncbi:hypothetical protein [Nitratireductor pacificus]|uniref:Uncharacterized protein n=1 Tax=Nitratireductor pacificus pht-3B TaxID=391937 RepID=K2M528_9HYPH|nr:hypothetical protein [Nitratireductor pacificus]EKF17221.1 hypothetical protein NA2_18876 [Nitratireductor pacificus pht-3B]
MHNRFPQRPKGRPPSPDVPAFDPTRQTLHDRKLAAWALTLGARLPLDGVARRRPHRGQLPDVDLTRAEPAVRPSWRDRLAGWFR